MADFQIENGVLVKYMGRDAKRNDPQLRHIYWR